MINPLGIGVDVVQDRLDVAGAEGRVQLLNERGVCLFVRIALKTRRMSRRPAGPYDGPSYVFPSVGTDSVRLRPPSREDRFTEASTKML